MEISMDDVKKLRDMTGISVMQCRKALEEAGGDIDKAEVILRKRSSDAADKKADRDLGAGAIGMYVHNAEIGAMVLLSCETDFVARNEEFPALAREIAMQVAATNPQYISSNDIDVSTREAAEDVFKKEVEGKPADMKEKILEGKLKSYFSDKVLLDMPYIKDESKTIRDLLAEASQKFGERVEVSQMARFSARG